MRQLPVAELERRLAAGDPPLLLDVRAPAEFAVSHLRGARRAASEAEALALLAEEPRDREIVLYCSLGLRSSHLARALQRHGFHRVANLEGSIFAWANAGLPVHRDEERVREVHPFDARWGRYLDPALRARP